MTTANSSLHKLLVEGVDDKHVVLHLRHRNKIESEFEICDEGSVEQLLDAIEEETLSPKKTVGIMVDANDDLDARWQAIQDRLRKNNITPPAKPNRSGTIIEGVPRRHPRIGIWLMPDNKSPGELKDFIIKMIPCGDSVWPRSKAYINGIPEEERKFTKGKILRAKVHAWLATRREPRKMGLAITAKDLDIDGATCEDFLGWLRKLFG